MAILPIVSAIVLNNVFLFMLVTLERVGNRPHSPATGGMGKQARQRTVDRYTDQAAVFERDFWDFFRETPEQGRGA